MKFENRDAFIEFSSAVSVAYDAYDTGQINDEELQTIDLALDLYYELHRHQGTLKRAITAAEASSLKILFALKRELQKEG